MYRSAQMMFANLLLKHIIPSCSSPPSVSPFSSSLPSPTHEQYQEITQLFLDNKTAPYSMHKLVPLAEMASNRKSGEWIAPSEAIQVVISCYYYYYYYYYDYYYLQLLFGIIICNFYYSQLFAMIILYFLFLISYYCFIILFLSYLLTLFGAQTLFHPK